MLPWPMEGSYPCWAIQAYQVASQSESGENSAFHDTPAPCGCLFVQLCIAITPYTAIRDPAQTASG